MNPVDGGILMKRVKALVLVILFLTISSFSVIQTVNTQGAETEILTPNLVVSGTLSSTHLSDYFRIEISQTGVYKIELNSTGSSWVIAFFNRYSYGYPSIVEDCYSNSSDCFYILSSSQYYGSFYQLEVSFYYESVVEITDYNVSIVRVQPIVIEDGQEYTIQQDAYVDSHFILDVSESYETYRFNASTEYYSSFYLYDSYGFRCYYEQFSQFNPLDDIIILDSGIYHLFIYASSSSGQNITFQITAEDIPVVELDTTIQVDFEANPLGVYFVLPLIEGTQYSIDLAPQSLINVGFDIMFNPDYRMTIDDLHDGDTESIADFVFWENCMAYTGWDTNPEMELSRSNPVMRNFYSSSYKILNSALLLRAFCSNIGSATLRLSKMQDVQTLSPDVPVSAQFDGIDGPFWKLYKMENLAGGELYNFHLTHTPATDYILNPNYFVYTPRIMDQNYLSRTRPLLSDIEKGIWDNLPGSYTSLQYDHTLPITDAFYYHPILCESWLYVSIPDGYYYNHYSYDSVQSGSMEIEVNAVEPIIQNVDSQFTMDPSLGTSIYSLQLEGGNTYEVTVTGSNYQSHGYITLWNETGHQLPASYKYAAQTDKNTRHFQIEVECDGAHNLLVTAEGSSPLTITITKKTVSNGVQYPFFIGSLAVVAVEGIIIGIVIGKVKFGKADTG